ncbi:MAG: SDR family NAD(P)-dependent oxidoreductase [Burkholderiaceae bacterium]|nr:SDR family NAD(P)-dependent oxidoreductase [Burkholderiaceae bacterium]
MNVFITGASSGLGEGMARRYAVPGAVIGLCARRANLLEDLAKAIEAKGARAIVYAVDVADTATMQQTAEAFITACGGQVDLVIANAGIGIPHRTLQGESEPIAKLMRVNVIGVTNTVVPFVPAMVKRGSGTLVAVSSMAGHRGLPGRAAYSSSKAAARVFMDALRLDLHGTGVHAMTLCPGFVRTPLTAVLDNKLPFLIDCEDAVTLMVDAIAARKKTYSFPWQMRVLGFVLRNATEGVVRKLSPAARTRAPE